MKNNDDIKKEAVAINYSETEIAPKVVAKGKGSLAEKIIERAKDSDIPIYKDEKLLKEINQLELGDNIPEELYEVVAELLIFVADLDAKERYKNSK